MSMSGGGLVGDVDVGLWSECEVVGRDEFVCCSLGLEVTAPPVQGDRPPLAVVLALDTSGSMAGTPIRDVAEAARRIVARLDDRDSVGLVGFASRARVLHRLLPLAEARGELVGALAGLEASGGTALDAGLGLALAETRSRLGDGRARLGVVLLSDGAATVGELRAAALADTVHGARGPVTVSTLGFGPQHDESTLAALAEAGAGTYAWVAAPAQAGLAFARAIGGLGDAAVERLRVRLEAGPGTRIVEPPLGARARDDGLELELGALESGARRSLAVRLVPAGALAHGARLSLRAELGWHRPGRGPGGLRRSVSIALGEVRVPADSRARAFVLIAHGEQARARARAEAEAGRAERGADLLEAWLSRARGDGARPPEHPLSELIEQVIDDLRALRARLGPDDLRAFLRGQRAGVDEGVAAGLGASARALGEAELGPRSDALLEVVEGPGAGRALRIGEGLLIGRTASADLVLPSPSVSRQHARIFTVGGEHWLADLGSTQATELNGRALRSTARLRAGDELRIGDARLRYRVSPSRDQR